MKAIRHGDVILVPIEQVPSGKPLDHLTLALGEVTGHSHRVEGRQALLLEVEPFVQDGFEVEVTRVLQLAEQAYLRHEEHATLEIPAGDYAVITQRDYEPEGWRYVAD